MDPRIAIIRFYALCLAALACAVVWPAVGVGLWPVVFFFPGCVCCGEFDCGTIQAACNSGTAPAEVTVTLAGMAGTCTGAVPCSDLEGVYVLPYDINSESACTYNVSINPAICPLDDDFIAVNVQISVFGGNVTLLATFKALSGAAGRYRKQNHVAAPANCNGLGTVSLAFLDDTHTNCIFSGGTCDLTL